MAQANPLRALHDSCARLLYKAGIQADLSIEGSAGQLSFESDPVQLRASLVNRLARRRAGFRFEETRSQNLLKIMTVEAEPLLQRYLADNGFTGKPAALHSPIFGLEIPHTELKENLPKLGKLISHEDNYVFAPLYLGAIPATAAASPQGIALPNDFFKVETDLEKYLNLLHEFVHRETDQIRKRKGSFLDLNYRIHPRLNKKATLFFAGYAKSFSPDEIIARLVVLAYGLECGRHNEKLNLSFLVSDLMRAYAMTRGFLDWLIPKFVFWLKFKHRGAPPFQFVTPHSPEEILDLIKQDQATLRELSPVVISLEEQIVKAEKIRGAELAAETEALWSALDRIGYAREKFMPTLEECLSFH